MADLASLLRFEREGFLCCEGLLSEPEVVHLRSLVEGASSTEEARLAALLHQVRVQHGREASEGCRSAEDCRALLRDAEESGEVSFMQFFNLHRRSPALREVATSPRLGFWAAQLLGVDRVRLYQDALFMKRPGDGPTRWHSDLGLAPFDTNAFVTVWIPLTPVPAHGGSGLCFARGSHRDFALPYHGDPGEDLTGRYELQEGGELRLGDATFHHGWTLHSAAELPEGAAEPRLAWTVSFVADGARLLRLQEGAVIEDEEDAVSFEGWVHEVPGGGVVDHPAVPLVPVVS